MIHEAVGRRCVDDCTPDPYKMAERPQHGGRVKNVLDCARVIDEIVPVLNFVGESGVIEVTDDIGALVIGNIERVDFLKSKPTEAGRPTLDESLLN